LSTTLWQNTSTKTAQQHYALKIIFKGVKRPYHNFFFEKSAFFISIIYL